MVDPKFNEPAPVDGSKKKRSGAKLREGIGASNATAGFEVHDPSAGINLNPVSSQVSREEIALRAFELWKERGCPAGSPEIDWNEAEQDLLARSRGSRAAVASV
jgi:hypothetical protein